MSARCGQLACRAALPPPPPPCLTSSMGAQVDAASRSAVGMSSRSDTAFESCPSQFASTRSGVTRAPCNTKNAMATRPAMLSTFCSPLLWQLPYNEAACDASRCLSGDANVVSPCRGLPRLAWRQPGPSMPGASDARSSWLRSALHRASRGYLSQAGGSRVWLQRESGSGAAQRGLRAVPRNQASGVTCLNSKHSSEQVRAAAAPTALSPNNGLLGLRPCCRRRSAALQRQGRRPAAA